MCVSMCHSSCARWHKCRRVVCEPMFAQQRSVHIECVCTWSVCVCTWCVCVCVHMECVSTWYVCAHGVCVCTGNVCAWNVCTGNVCVWNVCVWNVLYGMCVYGMCVCVHGICVCMKCVHMQCSPWAFPLVCEGTVSVHAQYSPCPCVPPVWGCPCVLPPDSVCARGARVWCRCVCTLLCACTVWGGHVCAQPRAWGPVCAQSVNLCMPGLRV